MGFFSKLFGGGDTKVVTQPVSRLSPEQEKISKALSGYLMQYIGKPATPLPGPYYAEMPDLFEAAYNWVAPTIGKYSEATRSALLRAASGLPAWEFEPGKTTKRWRQTYAIPVMQTWRETVLPMIREEYNAIPGAFYSQSRARGVTDAANEYFSRYVQPQLYQALEADIGRAYSSAEAAAARAPAAAAQLTALPLAEFESYASIADAMRAARQAEISAHRAEAARMLPEASPWTQIALQYLGIPSVDTIAYREQPDFGTQLLRGGLETLMTLAIAGHVGPFAKTAAAGA